MTNAFKAFLHLLGVGAPQDLAPSNTLSFAPIPDQQSAATLGARARAAGAYVASAPPQWSGNTMRDAGSIEVADAGEVCIYGFAVECDRPYGFHRLDLLRGEGRRLDLVASTAGPITLEAGCCGRGTARLDNVLC